MHILGKIKVTSVLPEELSGLKEMAYNLWWSWNFEAIDLYREIDLPLWERLGKNPVRFIQEISLEKLAIKLGDSEYMQQYRKVYERYQEYIKNEDTWFSKEYPDRRSERIAYFSAEYGLHEVLPVYSGGLGVLSGDHCKSASDLGLPFTAIGLFYKQGYFSQHINRDGWQETAFMDLDTTHLPLKPVPGDNDQQLTINVDFPDRIVHAKLWQVLIGRVKLYLMDTNTHLNSEHDRHLTSKLYGGDQETRIQQEILLGIGGLKTLDALGIKPSVFHMNEGHSAFLGLELLRKLMHENGLSFREARETASSQLVFTNHTPVPAGNDVFPVHMIDKYFNNYWNKLGISRHEFLDLGLKTSDSQNFNMTVLAMKLAGLRNGVSKLHGAVTRDMFKNLWPGIPEDEIPISHVTNGIHTLTWLSPNFKLLYDNYLDGDWEKKLAVPETWEKVDKIPSEELWNNHCTLKEKMIKYLRIKLKEQRKANGESIDTIKKTDCLLDPNALTIGFARRFATYKRANLIFKDIERIKKILGNEDRPVQIIFAGKAHPADGPAHEVIKNINDIASREGFRGKVVLVENYNITLARNLVQGVDIWLNNPRRPLEASGTSGQKVCINGIINFSVADGWWCEGFNGRNGWTIGSDIDYENDYTQDTADSESMYDILENEIIPAYYERNEKGVPEKWVAIMMESIKSVTHKFSTHRMVMDYTNKMYAPCIMRHERLFSDNFKGARQLTAWKEHMGNNWSQISIFAGDDTSYPEEINAISGRPITAKTSVYLGSIEPSSVKVQVYYGTVSGNNVIENARISDMKLEQQTRQGVYTYSAEISIPEGGEYAYTFRIIPHNPELVSSFDLKLIHWAVR
jgi:glycogen phosphorylase